MKPIRLRYALIPDTSGCQDPEQAVKQFQEAAGFADKEKSVEVMRGNYVVRYSVDGPETLTELRRAFKQIAKGLFSEATKAAIRNLNERPADFTIEMHVRLPIYGIDDT